MWDSWGPECENVDGGKSDLRVDEEKSGKTDISVSGRENRNGRVKPTECGTAEPARSWPECGNVDGGKSDLHVDGEKNGKTDMVAMWRNPG